MSDEAGVFVHNVRPEGYYFLSIQLRLSLCQGLQTARPSFGFMARVVEKKCPHQRAKFARCLRFAKPVFVFDERLDLFKDIVCKSFQSATLRRSRAGNLLV